METPVKVIGWESVISSSGKAGLRIYGVRNVTSENGIGQEAIRLYINPEYCPYQPVMDQLIIAVENGRGYVDRVIVVA